MGGCRYGGRLAPYRTPGRFDCDLLDSPLPGSGGLSSSRAAPHGPDGVAELLRRFACGLPGGSAVSVSLPVQHMRNESNCRHGRVL